MMHGGGWFGMGGGIWLWTVLGVVAVAVAAVLTNRLSRK